MEEKSFDISMKKFAFKIAYFGQDLLGYETQPGSRLPTVERFLFKALKRVGLI
jgi:tRNA U38,U39,U40 pseudouridine synthase TruA